MSDTCKVPGHTHHDDAKRMADFATLAWVAYGWDCVGKWMAFKLADGSSNQDLYPKKLDAVRHNSEFEHCFIKLHPEGMTSCEAEIMLKFHRSAYDAGFRPADPDHKTGGPDVIPRIGKAEIGQQIQALLRKGR